MAKKKEDAKTFASAKKPRLVRVLLKNFNRNLKSNYAVNITGENYFATSGTNLRERITKEKESKKLSDIQNTEVVQKKPKTKKKKLLSLLFFLLNVGIIAGVLWWQISQDGKGFESLLNIKEVNWWYILAAVGCFSIGLLIDQIRYCFLLYKGTGLIRPCMTSKLAIIGRHYDIITPLGSGGQPFEIYYLNKYGTKAGEAISITMGKYIFHQIAYFIFITVVLFSNLHVSETGSIFGGVLVTMSWVGYAIIAVVIFGITLISLNRRLGAGLVIGVLKLLHKMKIVKNYNSAFRKVMKTVNEWQTTMKVYKKSVFTWTFCLIISACYFAVIYSIPYFVYCAFMGPNPDLWLTMVTAAIMIDLASVYNPLPVSAGTSELSFSALFATFFDGNVFWPLFIWKFIYTYLYMVVGLVVITYDFSIGNRRLEKYKEKWLNPPYRAKVLQRRQERQLKKMRKKAGA